MRRMSSSSDCGSRPVWIRAQHQREPFGIAFRLLVDAVEVVASLWRADEHSPAIAIGERRTQHLGPCARIEVAIFIKHDAIGERAAQPVECLGTVEPNARAVGEVHHQIGLALFNARYVGGKAFEIGPRGILRLCVCRREIGKAPVLLLAAQRGVDQVHDACHCLTGTTMDDQTRPALLARVERIELRPRVVAEINGL